jgi:apolipoprotein N-acyltransferase
MGDRRHGGSFSGPSLRALTLALSGAAISAGLLWLSAPTHGHGWLAWVALVPAAAVALRQPTTRLSRLAVPLAFGLYMELELLTALPFGIAAGQWGRPVVPLIADSPVLLAALAVPLVCGALYALRFGQALTVAGIQRAAWLPAVAWPAVCWMALDFLRTLGDPSGYWGPLFVSQADTPAAHLAAVGGPWLITFTLVGVNYALAHQLVGKRPSAQPRAAVVVAFAALAALLASTLLAPFANDKQLTVAAIQPGYDTAEPGIPVLRFWRERRFDLAAVEVIGDLAGLTREAAGRGADVVIWPEGSVFGDPVAHPPARQAFEDLSRRTDTTVVVPYFLPDQAVSESVVLSPEAKFRPPQSKQRPMWYLGERRSEDPPPTPALTDGHRVAALLGTDNKAPALAARAARNGASLIASSTHDWEELAAAQRAYTRLNAASTGLPVVRADWRFGSAIYGGGGRVIADAGLERKRTVVVGEISSLSGETLYSSLDDSAGWLAVCAVGAGLLLSAYARRRTVPDSNG